MDVSHRPRVFLDVSTGEEPVGRLTIELYTDKTPRTCENFRQLCTGEHNGLSYAMSPLHRIIDEFMVQGGDITKGDGTGGDSIYGGEFEDENLSWRELDAAGLVCSANRGRDTNGSQFFITLEPSPHLNGKHTIFGRLVAGQDALQKIAKVDVDKDDRPKNPVLVSRCGELERKKSAKSRHMDENVSPGHVSGDRGRRRRSNADDADVKMRDHDPPQPSHRGQLRASFTRRRQSDNVIDEGLRGRPRQRSGSCSDSRALSSESAGDNSDTLSPAEKHKRKREPSPSRHDRRDGELYERRRRSLPNQYAHNDDRRERGYAEEDRYRPSPRRDDHRHQQSGQRAHDRHDGKKDDRYRPSRGGERYNNDGRLDSSGSGGGRLGGDDDYRENEPPVKFKGRGFMKYREPDSYGRL